MEAERRKRMLAKLWEGATRQTALSLGEVRKFAYLGSKQETDRLLENLSREEYIVRHDVNDQPPAFQITLKGLEELARSDNELQALGLDPKFERQRLLLSILRRRRLEDIERGQWQTRIDLRRLSEAVHLRPGETAELLHIMLREGYMDGSLEFEWTPTVRIVGLTRKGLRAIGEIPASDERPLLDPQASRNIAVVGPSPHPDGVSIPVEESPRSRWVEDKLDTLGDKVSNITAPTVEAVKPIVELLSTFVSVLAVLAYPVGLIVLWIQLSGEFGYGFWRSLFAASLGSVPMVVGNTLLVLVGALLSYLLPMSLWYGYTRERTKPEVDRVFGGRGLRRLWLIVRLSLLLYPVVIAVVMLILLLIFPEWSFVEGLFKTPHRFDLPLWVAFLLSTLIGILLGGHLFMKAVRQFDQHREMTEGTETEEESVSAHRWSRYGGIAIVYASSILAGMMVAGLQNAALPTVELTISPQAQALGQTQTQGQNFTLLSSTGGKDDMADKSSRSAEKWTAKLLGSRGSYWYVICNDNEFLAISDKRVTEVTRIVEGTTTLDCPGNDGTPVPPEPQNKEIDDPEPQDKEIDDPEPQDKEKDNPEPPNKERDNPEPQDKEIDDPEPQDKEKANLRRDTRAVESFCVFKSKPREFRTVATLQHELSSSDSGTVPSKALLKSVAPQAKVQVIHYRAKPYKRLRLHSRPGGMTYDNHQVTAGLQLAAHRKERFQSFVRNFASLR